MLNVRLFHGGSASAVLGLGLAALSMAVSYSSAHAGVTRTYFSCRTATGKTARFTGDGKNLTYSYGKLGAAPDLTFSVPLGAAHFEVDMGAHGGSQSVSAAFNGTTYEGLFFWDTHAPDEASITVTRSGRTLANTRCTAAITTDIRDTD